MFNGSSAAYCAFFDTFDTLTGATLSLTKRKLFYFLRYTSGPANAPVKCCKYLRDDERYAKARQLLKDTFGQV